MVSSLCEIVWHSIVNCCLHECRPRTCHKGRLGRMGFCRLGFWHWCDVSAITQPHAWQRCHGLPLSDVCRVGTVPPQEGMLLTQRFHPFVTRFNPAILLTTKCNHDMTVSIQLPAVNEDLDRAAFAAAMSSSTRIATYYITAYISKVQPQIVNLWQLLLKAQTDLATAMAREQQLLQVNIPVP